MPTFSPNIAKTAKANITVTPAGLSCRCELYLVKDTTKYTTSGLISFSSTGGAQPVSFPITMPSGTGIYKVWIDIFADSTLIGAFAATENVVITPLKGSLVGGVYVAGTGPNWVPIAGATVKAVGPYPSTASLTTTTASDGSYSISNLEPGSYDVYFSKSGYQSYYEPAIIYSGETTELSVALNTTAPPVCTAGATKCVGYDLYTCKADGSAWVLTQANSPSCGYIPMVCTPNSTKCVGYDLYTCKADGSAWVLTTANSPACGYVPPECSPEGITKCVGYNLYACYLGKWTLSQTNSPSCGYVPPVCTPNSTKCVGYDLYTCKADGSGWVLTQVLSLSCGYFSCICPICGAAFATWEELLNHEHTVHRL